MICDSGWSFCCELTNTLRYVKPRLLQNAEFWPGEVGPIVSGNGGGISASGPPLHGFQSSANIVIPANGFVVFARP